MGKFIRRLFIILVILTIVFLVYRYINPDGASRLVDKVKVIPDNISGGSSQDVEFNITGTTLVISGDIDVLVKTGSVQEDEEEDLSWLEELNYEIDQILGGDADELTGDIVEKDGNLDFLGEEIEVEDIEQIQTGDKQEESDEIPAPIENEEAVEQIENRNNNPEALTDADYQQIEDIFGNLIE